MRCDWRGSESQLGRSGSTVIDPQSAYTAPGSAASRLLAPEGRHVSPGNECSDERKSTLPTADWPLGEALQDLPIGVRLPAERIVTTGRLSSSDTWPALRESRRAVDQVSRGDRVETAIARARQYPRPATTRQTEKQQQHQCRGQRHCTPPVDGTGCRAVPCLSAAPGAGRCPACRRHRGEGLRP